MSSTDCFRRIPTWNGSLRASIIVERAAQIRARHRLRTPDALQAATAAHAGATALVTNDPVFERVEAFATVVLDPLL